MGDENRDPLKWIRRGGFLAALVIGWVFILWQNKFYVSPPAVFVCLAYLAVLSTIYALWRTGVVVVAEDGPENDSTWGRSLGARGELEREKKTLLKAIKEAEFDREMGKLSKGDADEMIGIYRARAIEVIKELDHLDAGSVGTVREQIEREVKARLEIETKTKMAADEEEAAFAKPAKKKGKKDPKAAAAEAAAAAEKAAKAAEEAAKAAAVAAAAAKEAESEEASHEADENAADENAADEKPAAAEKAAAEKAAAEKAAAEKAAAEKAAAAAEKAAAEKAAAAAEKAAAAAEKAAASEAAVTDAATADDSAPTAKEATS